VWCLVRVWVITVQVLQDDSNRGGAGELPCPVQPTSASTHHLSPPSPCQRATPRPLTDPNYFGEQLFWWALSLYAVNLGQPWMVSGGQSTLRKQCACVPSVACKEGLWRAAVLGGRCPSICEFLGQPWMVSGYPSSCVCVCARQALLARKACGEQLFWRVLPLHL